MTSIIKPLIYVAAVVLVGALVLLDEQRPADREGAVEGALGEARPITISPTPAPPPMPGPDWVESGIYAADGPFPVDLDTVPVAVYDPYNKLARGWGVGEGPKRITKRIPPEEADWLRAEALVMPPTRGLMSPETIVAADAVDLIGFNSLDMTDCCGGGASVPPDPELAVGPNHVIAVVNVAFAIYDKSGRLLRGPITFSSFFNGTPNCSTTAVFDPNVLYDESADRFILGIDGNGTDYCIAATTGSDPLGAWHRYAFRTNFADAFFDYPHAGVGVDAIYMGSNQFGRALPGNFEGRVFAIDKNALYAGSASVSVATHSTGSDGTPQPMNLHGFAQGTWPSQCPHYIMTEVFDGANHTVWSWQDPFGENRLTRKGNLNLNSATGITAGFPVDVPQKGSSEMLQANDWRGLDTEYRNGFIWITNTISCNPDVETVDCIRWAKINPSVPSVVDAGVIASSSEYRFFPDLAVDQCEDIAIGYTKSGSELYPGVYAATLENGVLQPELLLKAGETPYTAFDSSPHRWGDYTGMTIDPDGTRFWYLGEYSRTTGSNQGRWATYIASFRSSSCGVGCPYNDNLTIQNLMVTDNRTYGACNELRAGPAVTVSSGGALTLTAGQRVELTPGFSVRPGSRLSVEIDPTLR
ncbi:MAG: hypothetical protein K9L82_05820 [Chromatiaceae bacterium]|nr:hypothetical protein [Chromatiaceae bacterium]MCF7993349.1 hypothetical protein [Chromatiaceae bacterium]MCF8004846.1 hypothetical protein [Chromatiaceae bacterium]MCF8014210.1 hypothetical protein [Chromatiaceae bacterium]